MKTREALAWFKTNFGPKLEPAIAATPFSVDMCTAIAYQESGEVWPVLVDKQLGIPKILELCVGDTLDDRSAFPRSKAELLAAPQGQLDADAREKAFADLKESIDSTGFELVPSGWFARWPTEKLWWVNHLFGLAMSVGLLTLGAPFWFNLLKNLMSLRPAVASLVEKRPTSAPALPAAPATPPSPS